MINYQNIMIINHYIRLIIDQDYKKFYEKQ